MAINIAHIAWKWHKCHIPATAAAADAAAAVAAAVAAATQ